MTNKTIVLALLSLLSLTTAQLAPVGEFRICMQGGNGNFRITTKTGCGAGGLDGDLWVPATSRLKINKRYSLIVTSPADSQHMHKFCNNAFNAGGCMGDVHLYPKDSARKVDDAAKAVTAVYKTVFGFRANMASLGLGAEFYKFAGWGFPLVISHPKILSGAYQLEAVNTVQIGLPVIFTLPASLCGSSLLIWTSMKGKDIHASSNAKELKVEACPSAKGDPHVTNMRGDRFDILKSGERVMVQYPRETSLDPSLVVVAHIVRADAKWCENTFIEKVEAHGSMVGSSVSFTMGQLRSPRAFKVTTAEKSRSLSEVIKEKVSLPTPGSHISGEAKQMTLTLAEGVSIRVQLVQHAHFQFFNLDVTGLSNLYGEVGGLLGMDDHSAEALNDCKFKMHNAKLQDSVLSESDSSLITAA